MKGWESMATLPHMVPVKRQARPRTHCGCLGGGGGGVRQNINNDYKGTQLQDFYYLPFIQYSNPFTTCMQST